ncbi:nuclear transport factor 2 family protein [Nonomuraea guangzhouensis]|uniref:Nuclear transport factor 2 family protein n=1 Tax=Nonomuraea guangzhouensis TaxID=1291555 RepID=A0ABW4GBQ1_9ACTN|nr:nuclear transport factor 2 family protein [Nonomuraea guangzhouensis]
MVLREYMACMDSQDPEKALECVEPDFRFLLALPGGQVSGQSREDFAQYISGRNAVERVHKVLRSAVDGNLEMVYGVVVESGKPTGTFHSAAVVSANGKMLRYQSFFTTSFELLDWPAADQ